MIDSRARRFLIGATAAMGLFLVVLPLHAQQSKKAQKQTAIPAPLIAVIDFRGAVRVSSAGQSVIRQVNEKHAQFQKEIQDMTAKLEKSRQELSRQRTLLAPEVFKQKRDAFQARAQRYQKTVQQAQKQLDALFAQGMRQVEVTLAKVVRDIATERGVNIVMDAGPGRGLVLFADSQLVITAEARDRLNKVLPDVKINMPTAKQQSAPRGQSQTLRLPNTKP